VFCAYFLEAILADIPTRRGNGSLLVCGR